MSRLTKSPSWSPGDLISLEASGPKGVDADFCKTDDCKTVTHACWRTRLPSAIASRGNRKVISSSCRISRESCSNSAYASFLYFTIEITKIPSLSELVQSFRDFHIGLDLVFWDEAHEHRRDETQELASEPITYGGRGEKTPRPGLPVLLPVGLVSTHKGGKEDLPDAMDFERGMGFRA